MKISSSSWRHGEPIDVSLAMGKPDPDAHATFAPNRNPHVAWTDLPAGTRSIAIVLHDTDAPTVPDDVNQEGRTVPADLPRGEFYHWVVVDVDPAKGEIAEGFFSAAVTAGGKDGPDHVSGVRQGINSYTDWFAGDPQMQGEYFGYDGPFPPWNDERTHNYYLTVYALDTPTAPVEGVFDAPMLLGAIEPHVLASASLHGTYRIAD